MKVRLRSAVLAGVLLLGLCVGARPVEAASTDVAVSGEVVTPTTFTLEQLGALPQTSLTVSYTGGETHAEKGVLLSDAIAKAVLKIDPAAKNPQLRMLVTVAGTTGRVVFAYGEMDPNFGAHPVLLSLVEDGKALDAPKLVVGSDKRATRSLAGVSSVKVTLVGDAPVPRLPSPGWFAVNGSVDLRFETTTASLERMAGQTQSVTFLSGTRSETHSERGPLLIDALGSAWPVGRLNSSALDLTRYVVATGSDGYAAVLSWGEIDPAYGATPVLLATAEDGVSLASVGPRVVVPGDKRGGRYVSGIVALTVLNVR